MKKKWLLWFLSFGIFIIGIFPFILLSQYTTLSEDDFRRAHAAWGTFFEDVRSWYFHHNGRYTNAIFSFLPIYYFPVYQIMSAFSFFILVGSIFGFLKALFIKVGYQLNSVFTFFLSLLVLVFIIQHLDSPAEFFYWYAGMTVYLLSLCLFLVLVAILITGKYKSPSQACLFALLIVISNGNNEMLMVMTNGLLLLFLFISAVENKLIEYRLLLFNLISWISSAVVFFAPGTVKRRNVYTEGGDFLSSLKYSFFHTGRLVIEYMGNISYLTFFAGLLLLFLYFTNKKRTFAHPVFLIFISFLLLMSNLFVLIYSQGVLLAWPRVMNFIESFFYLITLANIINFSGFIGNIQLKRKFILLPALLILTAVVWNNSTHLKAVEILVNGDAKIYSDRHKERWYLIQQQSSNTLILDTIKGPGIIHLAEIPRDSTEWQHRDFKFMVKKNFNPDLEVIIMNYE